MSAASPAGWVRVAGLALIAVSLFWLPLEDTTSRYPLLISGTAALLGFFAVPAFRPGSDPCLIPPSRATLIGALAGLAVAPGAVFLMVFKSGLHGHGFPDFTAAQLATVLQLTPILGLAGGAGGAGIGFWRRRGCPD